MLEEHESAQNVKATRMTCLDRSLRNRRPLILSYAMPSIHAKYTTLAMPFPTALGAFHSASAR